MDSSNPTFGRRIVISRRKLLQLVAAGGLSTVSVTLLNACGGAAPSPTAAPVAPTAPPPSGTAAAVPTGAPAAQATTAPAKSSDLGRPMMFLATDQPTSLDPAECWDYGAAATMLAQVYETLFKFTGADKADIVLGLAAAIPTTANGGISADGKVYTIKLRPEAKFHDGSPVDAAAVKFSYDRMRQMKLGPDTIVAMVDNIKVVDPTTVQFNLSHPFAAFLSALSSMWGNPVVNPVLINANKKDDKELGHDWLQTHDAGSGPYKLKLFDMDQKQGSIVRDPNWWQGWQSGPHIEEIAFRWITEPATTRAMIERGDADMVIDLTPEDYAALGKTAGIRVEDHNSPLQGVILLNDAFPPLDNVKVRQALAYAFNYDQAINGVMGGHATPMDSSVAKGIAGYAPAKKQYTFDLAKAKSLLAEAGLPNGFAFDCYSLNSFRNDELLLEMFQGDLKKIGVTLNVKTMDMGAFLTKQRSGKKEDAYPAYIGHETCDYPDAWEILHFMYHSDANPPASCCNTFYSSKTMDDLINQIEVTMDPTKRQDLLQQAYDLAAEDEPVIWLFAHKQSVALRNWVKGYEFNLMNGYDYAPFAKMSIEK